MSDGPYRNLPLNRPWKNVAAALSQEATTISEACALMSKAVEKDIANQNGKSLISELEKLFGASKQPSLFTLDPLSGIDLIEAQYPKTPFVVSMCRHARLAFSQGKNGQSALKEALTCAISEVSEAGIQSIREHSSAKQDEQSTLRYTRGRCDEASGIFDNQGIADLLLKKEKLPKTVSADRNAMLDEGPEL
ncbi:MAG: hypothetical protein SFZ03_10245 [Candidatus Melainabacteria bacterium]|nr:hypothetical protein [Candidatus Melainabacteria bacterium]